MNGMSVYRKFAIFKKLFFIETMDV
jgi:hypothetical protein